MRLYLDDNLDSNVLIGLVRQAGHEVISPRAVGTRGVTDEEHLRYAAAQGMVLLTANVEDFLMLHEVWRAQARQHYGILLVYHERHPTRGMTSREIAAAITEIERSGVAIEGFAHNLNFWRRSKS